MGEREFADIMYHLAGAYRDDRYIDDNVISTWYEYFKNIPSDLVKYAVIKWIKYESRKPEISDLLPAIMTKDRLFRLDVQLKKYEKQSAKKAPGIWESIK